jgi:hypothetical protein
MPPKLSTLLDLIDNGNVQLPEFQRDTDEQTPIRGLGTSPQFRCLHRGLGTRR